MQGNCDDALNPPIAEWLGPDNITNDAGNAKSDSNIDVGTKDSGASDTGSSDAGCSTPCETLDPCKNAKCIEGECVITAKADGDGCLTNGKVCNGNVLNTCQGGTCTGTKTCDFACCDTTFMCYTAPLICTK